MQGARTDDSELADILLYLLCTGQEYWVDRDELRPTRHLAKRRKQQQPPEVLSKVEAKRARKRARWAE